MNDQRLLSIVLVTLVTLGVAGAGIGGAVASADGIAASGNQETPTDTPADETDEEETPGGEEETPGQGETPADGDETPADGDEAPDDDEETPGDDDAQEDQRELETTIDVSALNATALDAAQIAQNETGATPVAVKLGLENQTARFGVLVVNDAGNVSGVVVNATDRQVVRVVDNLGTINATVLQDVGGVSNVTDLRSAVDAIRAAQEAAPENAVPIEVAIEADDGMLLQQVTFAEPTDGTNRLTKVYVDATRGPVVGVVPTDDPEDVERAGPEDEPAGPEDEPAEEETEDADAGTPEGAETPGNETGTETPSQMAVAGASSAAGALAAPQYQVGQEGDDGIPGIDDDDAFAEDDEFDAGDDVGLIDFNTEVFGEDEAGQDLGADAENLDEDGDDGYLDDEEEGLLEGDEGEDEDEFGDDDFGF